MKKYLTLICFAVLLASCGKNVELDDIHESSKEELSAVERAPDPGITIDLCMGNCNHVPIFIDRTANTYSSCPNEQAFELPGGLDLITEDRQDGTMLRFILNEYQLCGPSAGLSDWYNGDCLIGWWDFQTWDEATEVSFLIPSGHCLWTADDWRLDMAVK
ncbi:MAG: hypothetical protein AAF731_07805 [Bacteroidota bacterium]